jgi:hypothetical protein
MVECPPMATKPEEIEALPDGWSDLTEGEREELRRAYDEADAAFDRGECIPIDEVLPRFREAG